MNEPETRDHPGVDQVRYENVDVVRIEDGALRILRRRRFGFYSTAAFHPATDRWQSVFLFRKTRACLVTLVRES